MGAIAAKRRLVEALEEFVETHAGDGGRSPRAAQAGTAADAVPAALELHAQLTGESGESETPGSRAARRAAEGKSGGFAAASGRGRDMLRRR
jgi:hypothetical protein